MGCDDLTYNFIKIAKNFQKILLMLIISFENANSHLLYYFKNDPILKYPILCILWGFSTILLNMNNERNVFEKTIP